MARPMNKHDGKRVVVVGAGNIGSQVVPLLARVTAVAQALIVDFDHYETKNLASQNITPGDVGRSKAAAMARALRRLNPRIGVQAACARIEAMPLGALRSDVILACLDSRQARRTVNRMAWRLGIPWIDAAVDQSGLFARVNVYRPAQDAPCLECAWEARDYELLSQEFSCSGEHRVPATNATAGLGALAAALQILELQKILEQDWTHAAAGTQFLIDARHHASLRSVSRRNSGCRFDHRIWAIEQMAAPQSVSLSEGFAALHAGAGCRQDGDSVLRLEG